MQEVYEVDQIMGSMGKFPNGGLCFFRKEDNKNYWEAIMKRSQMVLFLGFALTVLFYVAVIMPPTKAEAAEIVAVEGVSYNVNAALVDNLKALIGKKVYVTLDSSKNFAGNVKAVGDHLMHLEKLDGKEYFDALIKIDDIIALDTRFRNLQR